MGPSKTSAVATICVYINCLSILQKKINSLQEVFINILSLISSKTVHYKKLFEIKYRSSCTFNQIKVTQLANWQCGWWQLAGRNQPVSEGTRRARLYEHVKLLTLNSVRDKALSDRWVEDGANATSSA